MARAKIDTKALSDIFKVEIEDIQFGAEEYFKHFIEKNGLILTGELHESFRTSVIIIAEELFAEIKVTFKTDGRYLDMKTLNYKGDHPDPDGFLLEGFKNFIEKKGLSSFYGVPGYMGSNRMPITSKAINRLAYAMAQSRLNAHVIRRKSEGWYNKSRGYFVRDIRRTFQERVSKMMVESIAEGMETDMVMNDE
jgi:hypothetical protein